MLHVVPVPCLRDNYAYLLRDPATGAVAVVDPSEPEPVLAAIAALGDGARLDAILCTHHHFDHVGGNEALVARFPGIPVYAHERDAGRVPAQTERLADGARLSVGALSLRALHVPGHTTGALTYVTSGDAPVAFTGDTLFHAGCGRLFEGTAEMMHRSLNVVLAALPKATRLYPGHEYTASNLRFAEAVEPANEAVAARLAWVNGVRERGEPSVGATLAEDLATNPFLRVARAELRDAAGFAKDATDAEVFAELRRRKDVFAG